MLDSQKETKKIAIVWNVWIWSELPFPDWLTVVVCIMHCAVGHVGGLLWLSARCCDLMDSMHFCTDALIHWAQSWARTKTNPSIYAIVSFFAFPWTGLFIRLWSPPHSPTLFWKHGDYTGKQLQTLELAAVSSDTSNSRLPFFLEGWKQREISSYFNNGWFNFTKLVTMVWYHYNLTAGCVIDINV